MGIKFAYRTITWLTSGLDPIKLHLLKDLDPMRILRVRTENIAIRHQKLVILKVALTPKDIGEARHVKFYTKK